MHGIPICLLQSCRVVDTNIIGLEEEIKRYKQLFNPVHFQFATTVKCYYTVEPL